MRKAFLTLQCSDLILSEFFINSYRKQNSLTKLQKSSRERNQMRNFGEFSNEEIANSSFMHGGCDRKGDGKNKLVSKRKLSQA